MKKKSMIGIGVFVCGLALIAGVSFAFWQTNVSQKDVNKVTSDCVKLNIVSNTEKEAIRLDNAYPLTDEEAEELIPYEFTIENVCNTKVNYKMNLEVMNVQNQLESQYIDLKVNESNHKRLNTYTVASESYYKNEYKDNYTVSEKYEMATGKLNGKEQETFSIKLWIDKDVTLDDDVMNKSFISKVTISGVLDKE